MVTISDVCFVDVSDKKYSYRINNNITTCFDRRNIDMFLFRFLSVKTTPTDKRQKNTEKSCAEKSHKQAVFQQERKQ